MRISQAFHAALEERKVPHLWHVDSGAHEWPDWKSDLYLLSYLLSQRLFQVSSRSGG
jgi:S-formylglutathione hydrolase FrmB